MRTLSSEHSKGIFRQLASVEGATGVKTIIENHDSWVHNAQVQAEIACLMVRPQPAVAQRIARNQQALAPLIHCLTPRSLTLRAP